MKNQLFKRCIAWVLTIMMMINVMPVNAFATSAPETEHVHTDECIDSHEEGYELPEEEEEPVVEETTQEEITDTVSENVKKVQQMIDDYMVKYNLTVGMSEEDITNAVYAATSDPRPDYEAIIAEAEKLTEDEIVILIESHNDEVEVISKFYDTIEVMNNPVLIATEALTLNNQIKVSGAHSTSMGTATTSVTASESGNGITVTNTIKSGWIVVTYAGQADYTFTLHNNTNKKAVISFDYVASGYNSVKINGGSGTSASFEIDANSSVTIGTASGQCSGKNKTETYTLTLTNFTYEEVKSLANVAVNFDSSLGSVTIDGTSVSNGSVNLFEDAKKLVATPTNGAKFFGWINTADNSVLSTSATYDFFTEKDINIKAVFAKDGDKGVYGVSSAKEAEEGTIFVNRYTYYTVSSPYAYLFDDFDAALSCANTTSSKYVVLLNNAVLPAGNYTIPKGVTFLVPFDAANTLYKSQSGFSDNTEAEDAQPIVISEYRRFTMSSGANIIVNGEISVSAKHEVGNGGMKGCVVKGPYGHIKMETGSSITVNNGAKLYAWGYITGDGAVTAKNGSKIYELFQITDYRGGTVTSEMKDKVVFPFSQYYVQNIEAPLTIEAGAQDIGYISLFMGMPLHTEFSFVSGDGGGAMFQITEGSVTKRYDGTTDRLLVELNEDSALKINGVSVKVATTSLNTKDYNLPITNNITMRVNSGSEIYIDQSVAFLPGSELYIEEGAVCQLGGTNNKNWNVFLYDVAEWGEFCGADTKRASILDNAPSRTYNRTAADLKDAKIVVDGELKIYGNVYSTKSGADVSSTGTGVIELLTGIAPKDITQQVRQVSTVYEYIDIPITAAQVKNADGSVVTLKENAKGTYSYDNGVWKFACATHTMPETEPDGSAFIACYKHNCVVCGAEIPAADHTFESNVASCVKRQCTTCHELLPGEKGHTPVGDDCETLTCSVCGESQAKNHTPVTDETNAKKDPTCTETGLTEGKYCEECKKVTVAQEVIPATGHKGGTPVTENNVDVTCTTDGQYDTVVYCTECNTELSRETTVVKHEGHKEKTIPAVAPNCTETGLTAGTKCSVCDITLKEQTVVPKTGHTEAKIPAVAPNCTETGLAEGTKCSVCNITLKEQTVVPATGHTEVKVPEKPATCTETGLTEGLACTVCETYIVPQVVTEALGHISEVIPAQAPTCTETGLTAGERCTREGCVAPLLKAQETVDATGHNYVDYRIVTQATCYAEGKKELKCESCNDIIDEIIEKSAHVPGEETIDEGSIVSPGCVTEGYYYNVVNCSECNIEMSRTKVTTPAKGHTRSDVFARENVNDATCTEPGSFTKVTACSVCKKGDAFVEVNQVIDPLGHNEVNHDAKAPTCTDIGWDAYETCTRCDYTTYVEKQANGHTWDDGVILEGDEPTCKATGTKTFTCTVDSCNGTKTETVEIDRTAHKAKDAVEENRVEPTCTETGSYDSVVYCELCKAEMSRTPETIDATGHRGGEPQVTTVDSTCTVAGTKTTTVYCVRVNNDVVCNHKISEVVENLKLAEHTPAEAVEENRVEPTCEEDGSYDSVVCCELCSAEISRTAQTIDATGHTWNDGEILAGDEPTCEEKGTKTFECTVDGCDGTKTEDVDPTGHDWEYITSVKPTCTEPGKASSSVCLTCGKYVKDTEGTGADVPPLGHSYVFVSIEAPTCLAEGNIIAKCTRCQDVINTPIAKLEHTRVEIPAVAPTCTEDGTTAGEKCTVCNTVLVEPEVDSARQHVEIDIDAVAPTCTQEGRTAGKKCSVCGEETVATETVPATGHNGNVTVGKKEPTCTISGYEAYNKCSACGEIVEKDGEIWKESTIKEIAVKKHVIVECTENHVDPTCTAEGKYDHVFKCENCNEDVYRKTIAVPVIPHVPGEPVTENNVDVTCTTDGKYDTVVYCTACNGELSRTTTTVKHEGHKEEAIPAVPVTCTENGLTEGKKCTVCGGITLAQTTVYAEGHDYTVDSPKAATCTETGLTEGKHCSKCSEIFVAQEVIPALKHQVKTLPSVEPTCTTTGITKGEICTREGCATPVLVKQEVIPVLGHEEKIIEGKAATCTEKGITEGKNCTREGCVTPVLVAQKEIPAKGHTEKVIPAVAATCTETGLKEGVRCSVCEKVLVEQEVVPVIPHTEETIPAVAATCTETGLKEGVRCSVCKTVLVEQEIAPVIPHTEETIPAVAATCTETGLKEGVRCSVCKTVLVEQEIAPVIPHTEEVIPAVAATCTETGLKEGVRCSVCEKVLVEQEVVPVIPHTEETIPAVAATCTETGLKEGVRCSVCKAVLVEQEVAPIIPHTEEVIPAVAPTCKRSGLKEGVRCSECEKVLVEQEVDPATGHTEAVNPAVEPTCTKTGLTEGKYCSVCYDVLVEREVIPEKGHEWDRGTITLAPLCEVPGERTFTCSVCRDKKVEEEPAFEHVLETIPAQKPTYTDAGWEEYVRCIRDVETCQYNTKVEIPKLGDAKITSYDEFIENLTILETFATEYKKNNYSKLSAEELVIKYIRTGVDRYNSTSWQAFCGSEDEAFADFVKNYETSYNNTVENYEDLMKVTGLKNIEEFNLPNGNKADLGHVFGTMDISISNKSSQNHADVGGWAGDTVDLLTAADNCHIDGTGKTVEQLVEEIRDKIFLKDSKYLIDTYNPVLDADGGLEGSFSKTDMDGDLDAYYIFNELMNKGYNEGTLTEIISGYMTSSLSDEYRATYFLKNRLEGVSHRSDVRDAVYNEYIANTVVDTLEKTRYFENSTANINNMRKASCYVVADYLCKLGGDWIEEQTNPYISVFNTSTTELAPGITQKMYNATTHDGKRLDYYIAIADVTRDDVSVHANYKDNDPYISYGKDYSEVEWGMKRVIDQANAAQKRHSDLSTESYVPNYNVVAAFNGTGFNMGTGEPADLLVMEGVEVHGVGKNASGEPNVFNSNFFGILSDGSAIIADGNKYNELMANGELEEAISSFAYHLVKDGEINVSPSTNNFNDRAPRTAIGITKTGKVIMLAIDGRQDDNGGGSVGASPYEIAQIMYDAGCWQAVNLDGGGSTTYVAKQPGAEELTVMNSPSDGMARSVASSMFIVSTAPSSTEFDHAVIESDYTYLTVDSTAQLSARAVSATGGALDMPEGVTWAVNNASIGTISEDGIFTATAKGEVKVELKLGEEVVGSKTLYVVDPNNVFFTRENVNVVYGKASTLPVKVVYDGKEVSVNRNDIIITLSNEAAGVVDGFDFIGDESSGLRKITATVALKNNEIVKSSATISMFSEDESSFDFENATGGDAQLAYDREVSNSTYSGNGVYKVIDIEEDMVTSYTFGIDMSKIEMPAKLNDLTYMLPGADLEDASAWKFLLSLAGRVSNLTTVQATLKFDPNMEVDYSELTVTNEYFEFKEAIFDEENNSIKVVMNWIDKDKAIDEDTANPLCVLSGIKLTPKDNANWTADDKLNVVTSGDIYYAIYLGASSLYTFAGKPENQETYDIYPYENLVDTSHPRGGYFQDTYKTFKDTYTLIKAIPDGWTIEDGGWVYYVDGERLTGITYIAEDGLYYNFGNNGVNIGQTPYTGEYTNSANQEFYIINGDIYKEGHPSFNDNGWINLADLDWRYYSPETGIREKVTVTSTGNTCLTATEYTYTSASGAQKVYKKKVTGHEYALQPDGKYVCIVCYHERIELSEANASLTNYLFTYTGQEMGPKTKVVASNGYVLVGYNNGDYYSKFKNNKEVGTAITEIIATRPAYSADHTAWRGNAAGIITLYFEIRPDLPTNVKIVAKDGTSTLHWTAAKTPDATYVIYKSTDGNNYTEYGTTTSTSYIIKEVDKNAYFKVGTTKIGLDENGNEKVYESINKTNAVSLLGKAAGPDLTVLGLNENSKPKITWSVPDTEVNYYVVYYSNKENFKSYTTVTVSKNYNYYTHTNASADTSYYYKVKVVFADGRQSLFSNIVSATSLIGTPALVVKDEAVPVLEWTKVDGASKYTVYRSDSIDGEYKILNTLTATTYKDITTEAGKTYYYKVAAVSAKGKEGLMSGVVVVHKDPIVDADVTRVAGETRYSTSFAIANATKENMGTDKFSNIIIASGKGFADALGGSYLAKVKSAPILMASGSDSNNMQLKEYISQNLVSGGTVYILGGSASVPYTLDEVLSEFNVKRLEGANRYTTNIAILKEAGVKDEEVLVCGVNGFADSLSASAVGKPILLVNGENSTLRKEQKEYLETLGTSKYYIIGGTAAINEDLADEISEYGTVERISGKTRYETSVAITNRFFTNPKTVVIASGKDFPDGLCGSALALNVNAPILLTKIGNGNVAEVYIGTNNITEGYILGGEKSIDGATAKDVFNTNSVADYQ